VGNLPYEVEAITRDGDFPGHTEAWCSSERYIVATQALARAHGLPFVLVVGSACPAPAMRRRRDGFRPGATPVPVGRADARQVGRPSLGA
jgi:hypothetical protein